MGTLFSHLLLGDWTAILGGHLSYAKVKPFAGQGLHLHSLVNTLSIVQIKKNVRNKKDAFQSVFLREPFSAFDEKKNKKTSRTRTTALYKEKRTHTFLPSWQPNRPWLLGKCK